MSNTYKRKWRMFPRPQRFPPRDYGVQWDGPHQGIYEIQVVSNIELYRGSAGEFHSLGMKRELGDAVAAARLIAANAGPTNESVRIYDTGRGIEVTRIEVQHVDEVDRSLQDILEL